MARKKIKETDPDAVVIFVTAYSDTEKAVQAIKAGATDFIPKPWAKDKLLATVASAVELRRKRTEVSQLKKNKWRLLRATFRFLKSSEKAK